jgi:hypothetical protein
MLIKRPKALQIGPCMPGHVAEMRLVPWILLRSRTTAFRGWSAYRDQIGFVPDPMNLRAGGSGRCARQQ